MYSAIVGYSALPIASWQELDLAPTPKEKRPGLPSDIETSCGICGACFLVTGATQTWPECCGQLTVRNQELSD